jgi:NAD(P)-dependent dehydrogenase (short-subunit alcohol dehydrogenase family)
VEVAEQNFGPVDVLVNNAAVSMPAPIPELTEAGVVDVLRTNLRGPLELMRAVWPSMARQQYGRILNMTSGAIWGRGEMSIYAASKGGVLALSLDAGQEGRALGIHVNALFRSALTRMTRSPQGDAGARMERDFQPERVAAVAGYLVSRDCSVTGMAFHAGGGLAGRVAFVGSRGHYDAGISAESVRDHLAEVLDLEGAVPLESAAQAMRAYVLAPRKGEVPPP